MAYAIRPYREGDEAAIARIMLRAIKQIGPRAYSPDQVAAWAARAWTADNVTQRIQDGAEIVVAADQTGEAVAYAMLEQDGHLDHLYCDPDHTRQGLAEALLIEAETRASELGCDRLYTEASELARAAFERAGYAVTHRRDFTIPHGGREVAIHNYAMEKALD